MNVMNIGPDLSRLFFKKVVRVRFLKHSVESGCGNSPDFTNDSDCNVGATK